MEIIDTNTLIKGMQDAVWTELEKAFKTHPVPVPEALEKQKLLTKKEIAEELDISLVTLTDWMNTGLPYLA